MPDLTTNDQTAQNNSQDQQNNRGSYADDNMDAIDALLNGTAGQDQDKDKTDSQTDSQDAAGDDGNRDDQTDDNADDNDGQDDGDGDEPADDKPEDIYAKEITLADNTKMSVGALKDFYQQQAIRELDLVERENLLIGKMEENAAIAEALNVIPESIRERVKQERQAVYGREYGKIMSMIPAWKDRGVYEADRVAIYDMAKEYGLEEMFSGIVDARAVKFLYDTANLRKRIKAAGTLIKQQHRDKPKPGHKPNQQTQGNRQAQLLAKAKTGTQEDKFKAIDNLLGG